MLLPVKKHYFMHFCCLFLKSSKAYSEFAKGFRKATKREASFQMCFLFSKLEGVLKSLIDPLKMS